MTLREIEARLDRYRLCADIAGGRFRTAYMLGMMVCVAAAFGTIIAMPDEWGWPRAAPPPPGDGGDAPP